MTRTSLRALLVSVSALALSACSDSIGPAGVVIEVLDGDGQLGLPGWTLERSLSVVVRRDDGTPMGGAWVRFAVTAGGGAPASDLVFTDSDGVAVSRWILGDAGLQRLAVDLVPPHRAASPAEFRADLLSDGEADLVVVHGALGPLRGVMLSSEGGSFSDPRSVLVADTLVPVPQGSRPGAAIAIFGHANRPLIAEPAWTEGHDTVHVTLEPPVSVDLWLDIREGPYEDVAERLSSALDTVELIWSASGMGVTVGDVTFSDRTGLRAAWVSAPCADYLAVPPLRIRVSVVAAIGYDGVAQGYACRADVVFVTASGLGHPGARLIAHELGHTFSLLHTSRGVMGTGPAISDRLHDGEAFIAHFDERSALNVLYTSQPPAHRRQCLFASAGCPPPLLEIGRR